MADDEKETEAKRTKKRREKLEEEIDHIYQNSGLHSVIEVSQRNILVIGRTRIGKSTIQDLLINPKKVPSDISMVSVTREPSFRNFTLPDLKLLLNIIDTPGVFERDNEESRIRSEEVILASIAKCVNLEVTKFHMVCFAFSTTEGIRKDDIEALRLFMKYFGSDVSKNSCLVITRCESKSETQRERLKQQLHEDTEFKRIVGYFKMGIFFTGAINHDDFEEGNDSVIKQFKTIMEYRKILLDAFVKKIEPFQINQSCISEIHQIEANFKNQIDLLQSRVKDGSQEKQQLVNQIENLRQKSAADQRAAIQQNAAKGGCIIC